MAYDPDRKVVVMFGGHSCATATSLGDLWEYDGGTWTERVLPNAPPARTRGALSYDTTRGVLVLHGGYVNSSTTGPYLNDTWELSAAGWRAIDAGIPPGGRISRTTYDPLHHQHLLFGGSQPGPPTAFLNDTWSYAGQWMPLVTSTAPTARAAHAMAYVPRLGGTVIFGGAASTGVLADAHLFDGASWSALTLMPAAGARYDAAAAYDPPTGGLLVAGGRVSTTGIPTAFSAVYLFPSTLSMPPMPEPRAAHAAAYDEGRQTLVVYGGENDAGCVGTTLEY